MSGHSKWANIKHKKEAADRKKGKVFSRFAKEIAAAAKKGSDPDSNVRLRQAILAAKAVNMPNANIERALKKGAGEDGGSNLEDVIYEGYGPGGVAVLVECLTDNRNRTAGEVRSTFEKSGGNLAGAGAVAWMFKKKSHFAVAGKDADEDRLMEVVLDAGAEDIRCEDGVADIYGPPEAYEAIASALANAKIAADVSEVTQLADTSCEVKDPSILRRVLALLDALEDLDDVQAVFSNLDAPQNVIEGLESQS